MQSFASGSFLRPSSNGHDPEKSGGARDRVGLRSPGAGQWYSPNELSSFEVPQKLSRSWQQPGVHSWLPFSPFPSPPKLETMQSSSIGCFPSRPRKCPNLPCEPFLHPVEPRSTAINVKLRAEGNTVSPTGALNIRWATFRNCPLCRAPFQVSYSFSRVYLQNPWAAPVAQEVDLQQLGRHSCGCRRGRRGPILLREGSAAGEVGQGVVPCC